MPPKKGKKGKKGKKELKTITTENGETIDENSRQFYLIQIKDLEDKLKRYQKKSDEMEIMCKKYETQYESSNIEKRDVVANLKKELDKRSDDILDLNDRLVGLQQAKEAEKEASEKQLADLRTEFQETKDLLTNQNNALCNLNFFVN
jgi:predicted  nucleic acid-binding Zn-ribbon protein